MHASHEAESPPVQRLTILAFFTGLPARLIHSMLQASPPATQAGGAYFDLDKTSLGSWDWKSFFSCCGVRRKPLGRHSNETNDSLPGTQGSGSLPEGVRSLRAYEHISDKELKAIKQARPPEPICHNSTEKPTSPPPTSIYNDKPPPHFCNPGCGKEYNITQPFDFHISSCNVRKILSVLTTHQTLNNTEALAYIEAQDGTLPENVTEIISILHVVETSRDYRAVGVKCIQHGRVQILPVVRFIQFVKRRDIEKQVKSIMHDAYDEFAWHDPTKPFKVCIKGYNGKRMQRSIFAPLIRWNGP